MKRRLTTELVQLLKLIRALTEEKIEQGELYKSTEFRVLSATVMPTLLYACEIWTLLERHNQMSEKSGGSGLAGQSEK